MTPSMKQLASKRSLVELKGMVSRDLNAVGKLLSPQPPAIDLALERLIAVPITAPNSRNDQFVFASWESILDALRSHSR